MAHIFISYCHADSDFAAMLKLELEKAAFNVWMDTERLRAGDDWREAIDDGIRSAFALVVVMSPAAKASEYATYEWSCAWGARVNVIPLLLQPTPLHPRLAALQYLDFSDMGARPWDKLIERLRELESQNQHSGVRVSRDAPPAVQRAVTALDSHEPKERATAIESLSKMSHATALEALAEATQHPIQDVRINAAFKLADITQHKDTRAVPPLIEALREHDSNLRQNAAKALGRIGDPQAVPGLLDSLHREDSRVRRTAATALSKIGTAAVSGLLDALKHRDYRVREMAAWALGEIGDAAAAPALIASLGEKDPEARRAIIAALVKIGVPAVPELLADLQSSDWTIRLAGVKLLGDIGDVSAVPTIAQLLNDEYGAVRKATAEVLGKLADPGAVPALSQRLSTEDSSDVLSAIVQALGAIGDASAIPVLSRILLDDSRGDMMPSSGTLLKKLESSGDFGSGLNNFGQWSQKYLWKIAVEALKNIGTPEALAAVEAWRKQQDNPL